MIVVSVVLRFAIGITPWAHRVDISCWDLDRPRKQQLAEQKRQYYEANKERLAEQQRQYYEAKPMEA
jgi:hypothetical protein